MREVVVCVGVVMIAAISSIATNFLDQDQVSRSYNEGYLAGHAAGVSSTIIEQRAMGLCDWARAVVISRTCTGDR